MHRLKRTINQSGLLLVEILLAVALTSMIALVIMSAVIYGRDSTAVAGDRSRAAQIANLTAEALSNIAQADYSSLAGYTNGTTYYLNTASSSWQLNSSPTTVDSRFTPAVVFSDGPNNSRQATITITWQANTKRNGQVVVTTYLTDWRAPT